MNIPDGALKDIFARSTCMERPEAINKLIDRQRILFEHLYIERMIRALTRVSFQLRSLPSVGYTTICRVREGKGL